MGLKSAENQVVCHDGSRRDDDVVGLDLDMLRRMHVGDALAKPHRALVHPVCELDFGVEELKVWICGKAA